MITMKFVSLVLLLLLGVIVLLSWRSGRRATASALPTHRHWMIRWLGGTLALGLILALAVGTWLASGPRAGRAEGNVLRPTREAAPLPLNPDNSWEKIEIPPCRLIFTFGVIRKNQGQSMPLIAESKVIEWPADRGREVRFEQSVGGMEFTCEWTPSDIFQQNNGGGEPRLHVRGSRQRTARGTGMGWSSSSGGWSGALGEVSHELVREVGGYSHEPLSVVPVAEDGLWLMSLVTRADVDDPLKEEPAASLAGPMVVENGEGSGFRGRRMSSDVPPGAKMFAYIGPASALLLLAAVAGAQVFRRRGVAFTALLAFLVLFTGAMDLVVWERRADIVRDAARPEWERTSALSRLGRNFFHTGRTVRYLEEMRSAKETSPALRQEAGRILAEMRE